MGFRIARKHVQKLRIVALWLDFLLPFALAIVACLVSGIILPICWLFAAGIAIVGVLIERWLFFAGRDLGPS
jgi:sulfite dehydrogenase (quinone) subunit SoeC